MEKRSLEQGTEMTGAPAEQQGEAKERKEQLTVPDTAGSSSSSSRSSESSTDAAMGLVDVCAILF